MSQSPRRHEAGAGESCEVRESSEVRDDEIIIVPAPIHAGQGVESEDERKSGRDIEFVSDYGKELPAFLIDPTVERTQDTLELNFNLALLLIPMIVLLMAYPPWSADTRKFPFWIIASSGILLGTIVLVLFIFTPSFYSRNGKNRIRQRFTQGPICSRLLMRIFNIRFDGLLPRFFIAALVCGYICSYVNAIWIRKICEFQPKHVSNSFRHFVNDGFSIPILFFFGNMTCVAIAAGFNLSEFGEFQKIREKPVSDSAVSEERSKSSFGKKYGRKSSERKMHTATIDELKSKLKNEVKPIEIKEKDENDRYNTLRLQGIDFASIEKIEDFEVDTVMNRKAPTGLFVFASILVLITVSLWTAFPKFIDLDENLRNIYESGHSLETWGDSFRKCGRSLPILTDKTANDDFLREIHPNETWIGLRSIKGELTWSNNQLFNADTDFSPDNRESLLLNQTAIQCIAMDFEHSEWNVYECDKKLSYACQFGPAYDSIFWFYMLAMMSSFGILAPGLSVVGFLWAKALSFYLRNLLYVKSLSMRNDSDEPIKLKSVKCLSNWMKIRTFYLKVAMNHNFSIAGYAFASSLIVALVCLTWNTYYAFRYPQLFLQDFTVRFLVFFTFVASGIMLTIMGINILIYKEQKHHLKMLDMQKSALRVQDRDNQMFITNVEEAIYLIEHYDIYPTILGFPITPVTLRLVQTYLAMGFSLIVAKVLSA